MHHSIEMYVRVYLYGFAGHLPPVLLVAGAAFAAIRIQRECLWNPERYSHIVRHLSSLRNQIHAAQEMKVLCGLLDEMNELTIREQQNWRIIFRFKDLEVLSTDVQAVPLRAALTMAAANAEEKYVCV